MALGFLLFGSAHIIAFALFGEPDFWAVGVVLSLYCALLYVSRSLVEEAPGPDETPSWVYFGLGFLMFGLLVFLRPDVFWQLMGALLLLGWLVGRLSLLFFDRRLGH
jgi:Ca2+/Na+ antiporter